MVCECHSITQAAKKFFVTQPAVTAAIRELEKEYAVRLVDREKYPAHEGGGRILPICVPDAGSREGIR